VGGEYVTMRCRGVAISPAMARRVWTCVAALTFMTHRCVLAEERIDYAELYADQASLEEPLIMPLGHEGLHYRHGTRSSFFRLDIIGHSLSKLSPSVLCI
jgi:hypothetical protein